MWLNRQRCLVSTYTSICLTLIFKHTLIAAPYASFPARGPPSFSRRKGPQVDHTYCSQAPAGTEEGPLLSKNDSSWKGRHRVTQSAAPALGSPAGRKHACGWSCRKLPYFIEEKSGLNPLLALMSYRKGSFLLPSSRSWPVTDTGMGNCIFFKKHVLIDINDT